MDEREIGVGRELIDGFMRLAASAADIWDVLWYFGRASVAPTARDAFLEAVIGLDSLLTTSGPNATYKFRLHGASLLAADSKQGEALYKELKKIYDKRSGVAHGRSDTIGQEDPDRVLHLLAQTIDATVCLHQEGILPVSGNEGLNKSIERLVRQRATAAASESLSLRPHCHSAEN